jgi:superfamily II DNA or RNA helicase
MTRSTIETRTQLVERYRQLSTAEQKMLQLFSVIYEPINRTIFASCFNRTGTLDEKGKVFGTPAFKIAIDKLLKQELLVQSGGNGPSCNPLIVEIATRDAIRTGEFETLLAAIEAVIPVKRTWEKGPRSFSSQDQFIREVRIGIYQNDMPFILKQFDDYYRYSIHHHDRIKLENLYSRICNNPFDATWFSTLSSDFFESILLTIFAHSVERCDPADEAFAFLQEKYSNFGEQDSVPLLLCLVEQSLLRGQLQTAQQFLELAPMSAVSAGWGWLKFLQGETETAIAQYQTALKNVRKASGKRSAVLNPVTGVFYVLALLKANQLREADDYINLVLKQSQMGLRHTYIRLQTVIRIQQGDLSQQDFLIGHVTAHRMTDAQIEILFAALALFWIDHDQAKNLLLEQLEAFCFRAKVAHYDWFVMESAELLSRFKPHGTYAEDAQQLQQEIGVESLVELLRSQEPWELCLNALANLQQDSQLKKDDQPLRLAWHLTLYGSGTYLLQPREQKRSANGTWGKGRPISLKRLDTSPNEFNYLTAQDRQVCSQIESYYAYGYKPEFKLGERAIASLIGHPHVYWEESPNARVEIVKGEPELLVKKVSKDRLTLEFSPKLSPQSDLMVIQETLTRVKIIEIQPEQRRIADIIGQNNRLEVPAAAKERVLAAIHSVSSVVTVHSDIGGTIVDAEEVAADPTPHIHLLPAGKGLRVAVLSRPFANEGPYYRPGSGGETVIAEIEGKRLQTTRNLQEEQQRAESAIASCPTLVETEGEGEWWLEEPEDCLELLSELRSLEDSVKLEWSEGERLRVTRSVGMNNFQMAIQRQSNWFEMTGQIKLDDQTVLDMQRLMELLNHTPSRFIPIGEGQYLALTEAFRKRLDDLRAFAEQSNKGVRFHPLASQAIEEFVDEAGDLKADKHWRAQVKRLREMENLQPVIPSTLQAELRDYQVDGFNWLARLAHWGVGACLADDMGLGKTLQSLALILTRAAQGATLILAPTSVCLNWISETARFAPTLNILQFGSGNRQTLLDQLQPFDVLVCSYGLLQQEEVAEMLAKVQWQTIILDEAQAIKNYATKRSQAAMKLQGDFKIITTGTPIENHLGELWTLFRFINPGLLGSQEHFTERFALPIERFQDKAAREKLRRLIQPFILRRTKNQVLSELPPRTEITLHVELSTEERVMYEAMRKAALQRLSESDAPSATKHLQVLAEITRLRRLCCNPRLVMPEADLSSSKLQVFGEVLEELLDNQHKTLVFSQFVDHLKILQNYLDERGISYQYLDGSTPPKQRKKSMEAFQAGEGDVFLISLKAGGTGLNLTAADYVIHMDPWWNPAVEDQASDRAYRMGQTRPVTIYRLVTKATIEEKIVELHQHKRDLADSLLDGTDVSGRISTDELIQLMQTL